MNAFYNRRMDRLRKRATYPLGMSKDDWDRVPHDIKAKRPWHDRANCPECKGECGYCGHQKQYHAPACIDCRIHDAACSEFKDAGR